LIVGVVVTGWVHERLMIRGVGPALVGLGVPGALADPVETLYQTIGSNQVIIATNDDWWNSAQADQTATLAASLGAFALGASSTDSVILQLFTPSNYTAIISSRTGDPGIALAEIYEASGL
jgi:hypothetical protein